MDEEKNGPLPAHGEEQETMEVTMTTELEAVITGPYSADMSSNTLTHPEAAGVVRTFPAAASPPVGGVCATKDDDKEEDDSDSDSSSSSSSSAPMSGDDEDEGFSQPAPIKTRDEVLLEELPAVDEVSMTLPEDEELQPVGTISSIIQQLVIIQSLKNTPPLTDDSIIFTSDRVALAKVFEVFGPVSSPLYILRFQSADQISSKGLREGLTVYCAPAIKEYTGYILIQQLKLSKGSDASWKNDQEPPAEVLDYSDDEKEQEAKRKLKRSKKKDNNTDNPAHMTQNALQQRDTRPFPPSYAGPPFRHQNPRNKCSPFQNTHTSPRPLPPPSGHSNAPHMYLPPPRPFPPPPPFPPASYPRYPPPFPPSFFNPSFSTHLWPPASVPFSSFPPPPPPPPPPPQ